MRRSDGIMTESASGSNTMNRRNVVDKKSFMSGEIKDFVFPDKQKFGGIKNAGCFFLRGKALRISRGYNTESPRIFKFAGF